MTPFNHLKFASERDAAQACPIRLVSADDFNIWITQAPAQQVAWAKANRFEAGRGAFLAVPNAEGGLACVLFGLGDGVPNGLASRALGSLPLALPEGLYRLENPPEDAEDRMRLALGWLLGSYQYTSYKRAPRGPATLVAPEGIDAPRVEALAEGMRLARDLINTPAEDMGPPDLEGAVRDLGTAHGAQTETILGDALLEQNYPMIHRVGRAGPHEPRLIDLRWGAPDAALSVTLVGKGVCFDTGGLDIKPSAAMLLMKKDMGGAAVAAGLASMIMARRLPVRLRLLIPAVENSVSATSFRPGDVLTSRKGIMVENRNTDAEGRLVLGDALAEAADEDPDMLIDFATLTGAARVALGPDLPAMFAQDDALAAEIADAGHAIGDPVWRMPLWDGYESDIGSRIADITNAPAGGMAGSVTAALFLRRFVSKPEKWVHFDVYGWTPKARPGRPEGAECHAALALFKLIEARTMRPV